MIWIVSHKIWKSYQPQFLFINKIITFFIVSIIIKWKSWFKQILSYFFGLARLFPIWLCFFGLTRFFRFGSVFLGFFSSCSILFFQNFNRFFVTVRFFWLFFWLFFFDFLDFSIFLHTFSWEWNEDLARYATKLVLGVHPSTPVQLVLLCLSSILVFLY